MSGKLCFGAALANAGAGHLHSSKAFCKGMQFRSEGTAIQKPITGNPHQSGSEADTAWDLGWTFADDAAGGAIDATATCCAVVGTILA